MIRIISAVVIVLMLFLAGCKDSVELDESMMVVGVGIKKAGDEYEIAVEAIAPSDVTPNEETVKEKSIILTTKSKTFFDAAREVIRISKRRLFFTHAIVWIIHEDLASEEDMLNFLDVLRREQMLRLNSYLFITDEDPKDIFTTDPIFSNNISRELVSGLESGEFVSSYPTVRARELFKMLMSTMNNGYLPIIKRKEEEAGSQLTQINGTAIIKNGRKVGKLDVLESAGLMLLNNKTQGASVRVTFDDVKGSFELLRGDTDVKTKLQGNQLKVDIHMDAVGEITEQIIEGTTMPIQISDFEKKVAGKIEKAIHKALNKLQKDFKADVTLIGMNTYRKQPKAFNKVKDKWEDIFSEAEINVNVDVEITEQGLIDSPGESYKKKKNRNPYDF
ncbi:Ger(x)C family spore germination protein [Virgibacillus alimentarius]|uniref:Ger(X)C family germination protein n=1 Tax=Virgibacillus alimentarius TaxID=698769 RepID=A0ABS4S6T2_9BACI|nr:Ger(x)C family spore germination protein [Virgibacillus alimentarius]MBP2257183.1 Ger(x)C family germination protein [Virgibacillus alimentarius]